MRPVLPRSILLWCLVMIATGCSTATTSPDGATQDATSDTAAEDAFTTCTNDAGHSCPVGHLCADEQGTNYCACSVGNEDLHACTALDAGTVVVECESSADCTVTGRAEATCVFFEGCAPAVGRCVYAQYLDNVSQTMCGCDGETYTGGIDRPYAHAGACP